ncbi:MAG TPA: radical SAM protein [Planctomycetota bacterium]|nr:radical SAM protein [Planctomycetota bacterium]
MQAEVWPAEMGTPRHAILSDHARQFDELRFAYPVVSRRSKGLSIGVNVNPDKVCNFHCLYCQVDRAVPPRDHAVDFDQMVEEVEFLLGLAQSGRIWQHSRFKATPQELRRVNDIAFSGDGEPTTYERLGEAIEQVSQLRAARGLADLKIIVITNASRLGEPEVIRALEGLKGGAYEIWAKLDAGTQGWFEKVDGSGLPLRQIVRNIIAAGQKLDLTIQSLFPTLGGQGPSEVEIGAYIGRLNEILKAGARLKFIQVYTTARRPADDSVGVLPDERLDEIVARVRREVPVAVEGFYGRNWE